MLSVSGNPAVKASLDDPPAVVYMGVVRLEIGRYREGRGTGHPDEMEAVETH